MSKVFDLPPKDWEVLKPRLENSVLRERFGVDEKNKAIISRIIKETKEAGYIKLSDENAAPKMRRYIPYWA
ncbi:MAG: hypothetical protein PUC12_01125 [Clostridiales bacterium]|nr:hypothetical protein [Clostridiales bacterium]